MLRNVVNRLVDGRVIGLSVETRLLHLSGEWVSTVVTLPVEKATAQGAGSAISYGRRYGLSAILGLTAEDDDGNAASKGPSRPAPAAKREEPEAGKRLHDRVPATPAAAMSLAKAETVELKGTRLADMDPERLASVRAWAVDKANNYVLAACVDPANDVLIAHDYGAAGNTSNATVFQVATADGSNISAGNRRFTIHFVQ